MGNRGATHVACVFNDLARPRGVRRTGVRGQVSGYDARMHRIAAVLLLALVACQQEPVVTETVDAREPIGVWYVGAPELPVHEQANDQSPVLATYQNGEAISVLAKKGEWAEVRTGDRSGWAKMADLTNAEGKNELEKNPQPKFRVM